jgi:hypothetical protein
MEIASMFILMAHVLCLVLAGIGVAFADLSLFGKARVDRRLLRMAIRMVAWALVALWLSGLSLVWIQTGFDPATIMAKPKLVAKLSVATLLTLNGILLHRHFFDVIGTAPTNPRRAANVTTLLATVSGASWLYAGFLGLAKALAPVLSLADFTLLYLLVLGLAAVFAVRFVRPRILQIQSRMAPPQLSGRPGDDNTHLPRGPSRKRHALARRHNGHLFHHL